MCAVVYLRFKLSYRDLSRHGIRASESSQTAAENVNVYLVAAADTDGL
jgi:hypothetical protein